MSQFTPLIGRGIERGIRKGGKRKIKRGKLGIKILKFAKKYHESHSIAVNKFS